MKKLALLLTLCCSSVTFANSACDNPKDDFDGLYCLSKVYQEADKELNTNFQKLNVILDSTGKKLLKEGQLTWMKTRNETCSHRNDEEGFFVNMNCAAKTTINRSQFLQDRIRECASAGCQNSKLE